MSTDGFQLTVLSSFSLVALFTIIGTANLIAVIVGCVATLAAGISLAIYHLEDYASYENRTKDKPRYLSQVPPPRVIPMGEIPPLESQVKIVADPSNEKRVAFWYIATLNKNQFTFQEKQNTSKSSDGYRRGLVCLDGCVITIIKTRKGGFFHPKNYIRLEHPGRPLLGSQYRLFVFFQSARQMEEWYYALERAASLKVSSEIHLFRPLSHELKPGKYSQSMDATWFTALSHRLFFRYFDDPKLLDPVVKILTKKFGKIQLPEFIRSYSVQDVQFGASLPHFSNIQLLYLRSDGSMGFSAAVHYYGGLHFKIEIVVENKILTLVFDKKAIPAVFELSLNEFIGDIEIYLAGPPSDQIWFAFKANPIIKMKIETAVGIGDDAENTNIPKAGKLIKELLKNEVNEKMVLPNVDSIPMPSLPKKKKKNQNWAWACDAAKEYKPLIEMDDLRSAKKSTVTHKFQPIDFSAMKKTPSSSVASSTAGSAASSGRIEARPASHNNKYTVDTSGTDEDSKPGRRDTL